ncbi:speckle-type POZ protein-like [Amblyomma americanum]
MKRPSLIFSASVMCVPMLHFPSSVQRGNLVTRCELTVLDGYVSVAGRCEKDIAYMADCRLSEDFHWLLESGCYADVTITVGRGAYRAHVTILASRSPVFRAMLRHQMLEALLSFVYTGRSPNLASMADSLFWVADKYCLRGLRDMCAEAFMESLDVENAATALITTDRHNVAVLRRRAIDYICAHRSEVIETNGWGTLMKSHADLAGDVVRVLFGCNSNSLEPLAMRRKT